MRCGASTVTEVKYELCWTGHKTGPVFEFEKDLILCIVHTFRICLVE